MFSVGVPAAPQREVFGYRVIAAFGDRVVMESSLSDALAALFGEDAETREEPPEEGDGGTPEEPEGEQPPEAGTDRERAMQLLEDAEELFEQGDRALEQRDLATYAQRYAEARELVEEAMALLTGQEAAGDGGGGDGGGEGTTTTTEETTPA